MIFEVFVMCKNVLCRNKFFTNHVRGKVMFQSCLSVCGIWGGGVVRWPMVWGGGKGSGGSCSRGRGGRIRWSMVQAVGSGGSWSSGEGHC